MSARPCAALVRSETPLRYRGEAAMAPRRRCDGIERSRTLRRASDEVLETSTETLETANAEDDALAAAFVSAAKRTGKERRTIEREREKTARRKAVDAPKKPKMGAMKDSRVRASQEPQQELLELFDEGSWGAMSEDDLVLRLGALFGFSLLVALGFVDNYDTYDELVEVPLADRIFLPAFLGALPPLLASGRALARWNYVDGRLSEDVLYLEPRGRRMDRRGDAAAATPWRRVAAPPRLRLGYSAEKNRGATAGIRSSRERHLRYFERTGWADGFMAKKTPEAAFRDSQAREAQTKPQIAVLQRTTALCAGIVVASFAGFVAL